MINASVINHSAICIDLSYMNFTGIRNEFSFIFRKLEIDAK